MTAADVTDLKLAKRTLKATIYWSRGTTGLTGRMSSAAPLEDPRAQLCVEVLADRYDCSERRLEHMDQALIFFRSETSRTLYRSPMNWSSVRLLPVMSDGTMRPCFSMTDFEIQIPPLCLRNVTIDFVNYRFTGEEAEKDWMVAFFCHIVLSLASGYGSELPPMNTQLHAAEDRPALTITGLGSEELAKRIINAVSLVFHIVVTCTLSNLITYTSSFIYPAKQSLPP